MISRSAPRSPMLYLFCLIVILSYAVFPILAYAFDDANPYFLKLAVFATLSAVCITIGSKFSFFDQVVLRKNNWLQFEPRIFCCTVITGFIVFACLAIFTAAKVPLVSLFECSPVSQLNVERELFFKGRGGWEGLLVYGNSLFIGALLPFTLSLMFLRKLRGRIVVLGLFGLYVISFLEKALFLKVALPLGYLFYKQKPSLLVLASAGIAASVAMFGITAFATRGCDALPLFTKSQPSKAAADVQSRSTAPASERMVELKQRTPVPEPLDTQTDGGSQNQRVLDGTYPSSQSRPDANRVEKSEALTSAGSQIQLSPGQSDEKDAAVIAEKKAQLYHKFFKTGYSPRGTFDHLLWRVVAVPVFTAADSLKMFDEKYNSRPLLGATSSFLAKVMGVTRISFEREVFEFQWGQNETGTGSANAVFFVEGFVNYGWAGLVFFSLAAGWLTRLMVISDNLAFQSLLPLFCFGLLTAGFIGLLLSNGFALVIVLNVLARFGDEPRP